MTDRPALHVVEHVKRPPRPQPEPEPAPEDRGELILQAVEAMAESIIMFVQQQQATGTQLAAKARELAARARDAEWPNVDR